jgi:hypothetical protein
MASAEATAIFGTRTTSCVSPMYSGNP